MVTNFSEERTLLMCTCGRSCAQSQSGRSTRAAQSLSAYDAGFVRRKLTDFWAGRVRILYVAWGSYGS